ncbi:MAG TPA: ATP synthase F1 subunit gamma [Chloroflexia bacterium]|nr:ATP synthase F1 subunit gamma [Chloroflexia bacterium]
MPSTREIRRRITSAKNVSQITRAMEMVAASRMRRAQLAVQAGRPYARRIASVMHDLASKLASSQDESVPRLLQARPVKNVGIILMTGDRGLAGALNTNVIRRALRFINSEAEVPVSVIAVGKKGRDFMLRTGRPVTAEFIGLTDRPMVRDIYPIARVATEEYLSGKVDAVYLIYTDFKNTLTQIPTVYRLLPVDAGQLGDEGALPGDDSDVVSAEENKTEFIFEPSQGEVLEAIVPRYLEVRIYQAYLEHVASFQSAQMVAMRNATENAKEMISDLTLAYNKLRQANITREIIEVSSGASALSG